MTSFTSTTNTKQFHNIRITNFEIFCNSGTVSALPVIIDILGFKFNMVLVFIVFQTISSYFYIVCFHFSVCIFYRFLYLYIFYKSYNV